MLGYEIQEIHHKATEKREKCKSSPREIIYKTEKELKKYKKLIYGFFGEYKTEKELKQLMEKLKLSIFDYSISYTNLEEILSIYKEYNEGMYKFVYEIFGNCIETDDTTYEDYRIKLNRGREGDGEFISSLFEKEQKEDTLKNSISNVYALVSLIDFMKKDIKEEFSELLKKKCSGEEKEKNVIFSDTVMMYCESISTFVYYFIKASFDHYGVLKNAIEHPHRWKKEENEFQIF